MIVWPKHQKSQKDVGKAHVEWSVFSKSACAEAGKQANIRWSEDMFLFCCPVEHAICVAGTSKCQRWDDGTSLRLPSGETICISFRETSYWYPFFMAVIFLDRSLALQRGLVWSSPLLTSPYETVDAIRTTFGSRTDFQPLIWLERNRGMSKKTRSFQLLSDFRLAEATSKWFAMSCHC